MLDTGDGETWLAVFFVFQALFCGTAVTIISGAVAERLRFVAYIVVTVVVSGLVYPLFGHWAWGGALDGGPGWLAAAGFIDFAGSTVVHSLGAWTALALLLIIGPRTGRFPSNAPPQVIQGHNLPLSMLGVILLWVGWFGFNGGSLLEVSPAIGKVILNTLMGGAAGLVSALAVGWIIRGRPDVQLVINGALAGLVSITASCNLISTPGAIAIGSIGGVVMIGASTLLIRLRIDDAVDAVPVHGAAGVWGTLAVALFVDSGSLPTNLGLLGQLGAQLQGVGICFLIGFGVPFLLLRTLHRVFPLRVTQEEEYVGLNVSEHGAHTDVVDLLTVMDNQARSRDLSERVPIEPFTEVGQIATFYNKTLDALEHSVERTRAIVDSSPQAILTFSEWDQRILTANPAAQLLFGGPEPEILGHALSEFLVIEAAAALGAGPVEATGRRIDGTSFSVEARFARSETPGETVRIALLDDVTARRQTEVHLRAAQKMESIGELAAGIAHEINTPTQFVGDNLQFLQQTWGELEPALDVLSRAAERVGAQTPPSPSEADLQDALAATDLAYAREEVPQAIAQSLDGVKRVADIVRAMKAFSHPDTNSKAAVDLNHAIETTVTVARNEWKYVADVRTELDPTLPPVPCLPGEINQVLLNLLVNAAQAIGAVDGGQSESKGTITLRTRQVDDDAEVRVEDTGQGVPGDLQARIFEPFFTTKEVGKGTGQGLALAHNVVVKRHGGQIWCESAPDGGATFVIRLPLTEAPGDAEAAA